LRFSIDNTPMAVRATGVNEVFASRVIRKGTDETHFKSRGLVGVVDYSLEVVEDSHSVHTVRSR
jgi:hypothetical protein